MFILIFVGSTLSAQPNSESAIQHLASEKLTIARYQQNKITNQQQFRTDIQPSAQFKLDEGVKAPMIEGQQFWDGNYFYSQTKRNAAVVDRFNILDKKAKPTSIRLPDGYKLVDIRNEVAYAFRKEGKNKFYIYKGLKFSDWTLVGILDEDGVMISDFRVLDNDKILFSRIVTPFVKNGSMSYFGVYAANEKKELHLDSLVDIGIEVFDKNLRAKNPTARPFLWVRQENFPLFADMIVSRMVTLADGFAVVFQKTGYVLFFKAIDGSVKRALCIFPEIMDKKNINKPKEVPILCYRPTREGRLLLATRTEDAVLNARSIFQDEVRHNSSNREEYDKKMELYLSRALEAFPDIQWWEFDPSTGDFIRQATPENMPNKLISYDKFINFRFWMTSKNRPILSE